MCYRSPGPRCSSHVMKAYERARMRWLNEGSDEAYERMKETEKELDTTPMGQQLLQDRIDYCIYEGEQQKLQNRLEYGVAMRQWMLKSLREEDKGDIDQFHRTESSVSGPEEPIEPSDIRVAMKEVGIQGSIRVNRYKDNGFYMVQIEADDADYRIDFNDNGSVLAFKEYDDDEELLTHAQPSVVGHLDPCSDQYIYARQVQDYLARLQDESIDWDSDEHAAKFTYFGEASGDINASLRAGTLSTQLMKTLDRVMSSHVLTEDTVVYSGIRTQGRDGLHQQITAGTFVQSGYLSTSTKESVARGFGGGGNYRGALIKITLPAGTHCHDARHGTEQEITLPRNFDLVNAEWEFMG